MISIDEHEYIWCEKFRPRTVEGCILPEHLKKVALSIVNKKNFQNLLFYSGPGSGKTTLARAICDELGLDYILINGSKEGRLIDTVRNTVTHYANTMSVLGNGGDSDFKVVIYDEFDNAGEVQMAVRGLMDEVSTTCRFIFTGNYISKIIDPIKSRTALIDFSVPNNQQQEIKAQMFRRCIEILDHEGVPYKKPVLAQFINKFFPDFRRIINELQSYSAVGIIDEGILELALSKYDTLIDFVYNKDLKGVEKWILSNSFDGGIFSLIIDTLQERMVNNGKLLGWCEGVLLSNKYQLQHVVAIDPKLNLKAFCLELMEIV